MSKTTRRLAAKATLGALILILGVAAIVFFLVLLTDSQTLQLGEPIRTIIMWSSLGIGVVVAIIGTVIFGKNSNKARSVWVDERDYKHEDDKPQQVAKEQNEKTATEQPKTSQDLTTDSTESFVASQEVAPSVFVQSVDQKFEQIAKMEKGQFVVYIARLFSQKGYTVKLTPVIDNYGIDMLVTKGGSTYAVACLLANKVLGAEDFSYAVDSLLNYSANTCIILTNTYFNKVAVDYAKANNFVLVDRSALIDNFMR